MVGLSANRAEQVWSRLAGCYGEALARKFGDEPPLEWRAAIESLNDYQVNQGIRRLLYSGKAHVPALPEFVRLCRAIGHMDDVPDQRPAMKHPALTHDAPEPDRWTIAANRRLLRYITKRCSESARCFGDPSNESNPLFVHNVETLVAMKNRWAEVMQETADENGVPVEDQRVFWQECIREAESLFRREPA
jgi:hypothetical protein